MIRFERTYSLAWWLGLRSAGVVAGREHLGQLQHRDRLAWDPAGPGVLDLRASPMLVRVA